MLYTYTYYPSTRGKNREKEVERTCVPPPRFFLPTKSFGPTGVVVFVGNSCCRSCSYILFSTTTRRSPYSHFRCRHRALGSTASITGIYKDMFYIIKNIYWSFIIKLCIPRPWVSIDRAGQGIRQTMSFIRSIVIFMLYLKHWKFRQKPYYPLIPSNHFQLPFFLFIKASLFLWSIRYILEGPLKYLFNSHR